MSIFKNKDSKETASTQPSDTAANTGPSTDEQKQAEAEKAKALGPKPTPESLQKAVIDVLKNIYDPEIPVNIYDLGLIYDVNVEPVNEGFRVKILMTMTAPDCPEAEYMFMDVRQMVQYIDGIVDVDVELTFDPPWTPDKLTDEVKLELGLM
jgi:FeS assembly SUF system protein